MLRLYTIERKNALTNITSCCPSSPLTSDTITPFGALNLLSIRCAVVDGADLAVAATKVKSAQFSNYDVTET